MSTYEETVDHLIEVVQRHEAILSFQKAEQKLQAYPELEYLTHEMKAYQQDAVLFKQIDKIHAEEEASQKAERLKEELTGLPIVQDYRNKMQDASDLIQYVTKRLEDKVNEELVNGK